MIATIIWWLLAKFVVPVPPEAVSVTGISTYPV
jgi:hypothetical protein